MNLTIVDQLLAINRKFYDRFGNEFSATRQRLQPGVKKILNSIKQDESVLDLGCGNGYFLHEVSRRGHKQTLLGADFSLPLLRDAESQPEGFSARFMEIDITKLSVIGNQSLITDNWSLITAFALLHHIPSHEIRLDILRTVQKLLKPNGKFILSNWQFLNSEKLKARIQPWAKVGLSNSDVDEGDYLLDWRSGGEGLRYVHHFSVEELLALAGQAGMRVSDSFLSDGESGNLSLYQTWHPK